MILNKVVWLASCGFLGFEIVYIYSFVNIQSRHSLFIRHVLICISSELMISITDLVSPIDGYLHLRQLLCTTLEVLMLFPSGGEGAHVPNDMFYVVRKSWQQLRHLRTPLNSGEQAILNGIRGFYYGSRKDQKVSVIIYKHN